MIDTSDKPLRGKPLWAAGLTARTTVSMDRGGGALMHAVVATVIVPSLTAGEAA